MMNPYDVQRVYERGLVELAREHGRGRAPAQGGACRPAAPAGPGGTEVGRGGSGQLRARGAGSTSTTGSTSAARATPCARGGRRGCSPWRGGWRRPGERPGLSPRCPERYAGGVSPDGIAGRRRADKEHSDGELAGRRGL